MNAMSNLVPATAPGQPRVTRRSLAKQQTREKVLQAARRLFCERGYEAATIRDIAAAAGMSTGAVFASFSDKSELFDEIINDDSRAMVAPMKAAALAGASVEDALLGLFSVAHRYQVEQLPLVQAGMAVSWTRSKAGESDLRSAVLPIMTLLNDVLRKGVDRGELSQQADLQLLSGILWDVYIAGYRRAVFDDWSAEELTEGLAERIRLILDGSRA
jgi:AcrR family transcriptional regulator